MSNAEKQNILTNKDGNEQYCEVNYSFGILILNESTKVYFADG
jgi:hypothetical protein